MLSFGAEVFGRSHTELYRGGIAVDTSRLDDVLAHTDGVTARVLSQRAAALDELLDTRNAISRTLLGSR